MKPQVVASGIYIPLIIAVMRYAIEHTAVSIFRTAHSVFNRLSGAYLWISYPKRLSSLKTDFSEKIGASRGRSEDRQLTHGGIYHWGRYGLGRPARDELSI